MANQPNRTLSIAQRKQLLLVDGAIYRAAILESKNVVQANLHPDAMAKAAINHMIATASATVENLFPLKALKSLKDGNFQALIPVLTTCVALLSSTSRIRPILRTALTLAAAGAAAYAAYKKARSVSNE